MAVSFLFSLSVLHETFFGRRSDSFSLTSQTCFNEIFNLCKEYETCSAYSPAQVIDKIKKSFNPDQQARFNDCINRENTTLGVIGFSPEDKETLLESGKALSEKGYTIVIINESEKNNFEKNERLIAITPSEFLFEKDEAKELYELVPFKEKEYMEFLLLTLFRKDVCSKMKDFFNNNEIGED